MSEASETTKQKPVVPEQTITPAPRPSTGRTAGEVWIAEAKIVPADEEV